MIWFFGDELTLFVLRDKFTNTITINSSIQRKFKILL